MTDILLITWVVVMILGSYIGHQKGRFISGLVWTFLFGPIGLVVVVCLPAIKTADGVISTPTVSAHTPNSIYNPYKPKPVRMVFLLKDGKKEGPFTPNEIRKGLQGGGINSDDLAWCDGLSDWQPVADVLPYT